MRFIEPTTLEFQFLGLEQGFRRQGLFEAFTKFFPDWSRANGFDIWQFEVSNEGVMVFKKAGFPIQPDGTVEFSLATPPALALSYEEWVKAGKPNPEPVWRADL